MWNHVSRLCVMFSVHTCTCTHCMCVYTCLSIHDCTCMQANEMLLAGVKLTSQEAYERGLVTRVYPQAEFHQKLKEAAQHVASLPPKVYTVYIVQCNTLYIHVCTSMCVLFLCTHCMCEIHLHVLYQVYNNCSMCRC